MISCFLFLHYIFKQISAAIFQEDKEDEDRTYEFESLTEDYGGRIWLFQVGSHHSVCYIILISSPQLLPYHLSPYFTLIFLSPPSLPLTLSINIFVPYSITYHNWYSLCVSRSLSITTESTSATPEYLLSCLLSGAYYLPQESLLRTQSSGGRNFINNVASLFDYWN